MKTIAEFG